MSRARRIVLALAALVGAVAIAVGTWILAVHVQSPAQREAAAAPPSAGPVTVPVERGDLVEQTTVLATAARAENVSISVPAPVEGKGVVTRSGVTAGTSVASGTAVLWVNSRPVVALTGQFALYRDLYMGAKGDDVRMIQQALADLGYGVNVDGELGTATAAAVRALYAGVGAQAPQQVTEQTEQSSSPPDSALSLPSGAPTTGTSRGNEATLVLSASEVMIVPTLPAIATAVPGVGTVIDGEAAVVFGTQDVTLSASVPPVVQARLTAGVGGTAEFGGQAVEVSVVEVNAASQDTQSQTGQPQEGTESSADATVVFRAVGADIPETWVDHKDILITLNLSEPILDALLVPQRAISADASGTASVLVEQDGGSFTQVMITELGCVAGTCAVEAEDDRLTEDMSVRVDG